MVRRKKKTNHPNPTPQNKNTPLTFSAIFSRYIMKEDNTAKEQNSRTPPNYFLSVGVILSKSNTSYSWAVRVF